MAAADGNPQGYNAAAVGRFASDTRPSAIIEETGSRLGTDGTERTDRIWIKAANWSIMEDQRAGRIGEWAAAGRRLFPIWVTPRYLSGLDWSWLSDVTATQGMRRLVGNADAVHVLFLKLLEEFRRESVPLRLAIEPIARKAESLDAMAEWLHAEFGPDTRAFVRFFLSADTILKLRLADNYMAAVSCRLELLTDAVRCFGFDDDVFGEEELRREQDVLTALLCRMSVGAQQFEIGWSMLSDSAVGRIGDAYSAYETVSQAVGNEEVRNLRRAVPYQFSNGAAADYEASNKDWPLVLVIGGIIDNFLTHPATGIESILSVRIRHDAFRREYETALHQVENCEIQGVGRDLGRHIAERFPPAIYREIQRWLDAHIHTKRKERPFALFDFTPSKSEMSQLVEVAAGRTLTEIIEMVFEWLRPRLDRDLAKVRRSLIRELAPALEKRIIAVRNEASPHGSSEEDVKRVADAVSGAVRRRTDELQQWFKVPDRDRDQSLTFDEVMNAVRQRFRLDHAAGRLHWPSLSETLRDRIVAPQNIRHLYDLLSEVVRNAIRHGAKGGSPTRIHIMQIKRKEEPILLFSNSRISGEPRSADVAGHPYRTVNDSLFGEGKSGLKKIAYLAASVLGYETAVSILERGSYFHLAIPLDIFGTEGRT